MYKKPKTNYIRPTIRAFPVSDGSELLAGTGTETETNRYNGASSNTETDDKYKVDLGNGGDKTNTDDWEINAKAHKTSLWYD